MHRERPLRVRVVGASDVNNRRFGPLEFPTAVINRSVDKFPSSTGVSVIILVFLHLAACVILSLDRVTSLCSEGFTSGFRALSGRFANQPPTSRLTAKPPTTSGLGPGLCRCSWHYALSSM